jgi:hypothetical protein
LINTRLGVDYPDTVSLTVRLIHSLAQQNKQGEAIKAAGNAEEHARQILGSNHPVTQKYAGVLQALKNPK